MNQESERNLHGGRSLLPKKKEEELLPRYSNIPRNGFVPEGTTDDPLLDSLHAVALELDRSAALPLAYALRQAYTDADINQWLAQLSSGAYCGLSGNGTSSIKDCTNPRLLQCSMLAVKLNEARGQHAIHLRIKQCKDVDVVYSATKFAGEPMRGDKEKLIKLGATPYNLPQFDKENQVIVLSVIAPGAVIKAVYPADRLQKEDIHIEKNALPAWRDNVLHPKQNIEIPAWATQITTQQDRQKGRDDIQHVPETIVPSRGKTVQATNTTIESGNEETLAAKPRIPFPMWLCNPFSCLSRSKNDKDRFERTQASAQARAQENTALNSVPEGFDTETMR